MPISLPPPTPTLTVREEKTERAQPGLIRNIPGMSESKAAKQLYVKPAKIREWLESGALKGFRRVSGTWKITQHDLVEFARNRRDLLLAAADEA